jgi:hypothetical protein
VGFAIELSISSLISEMCLSQLFRSSAGHRIRDLGAQTVLYRGPYVSLISNWLSNENLSVVSEATVTELGKEMLVASVWVSFNKFW